MEIGRNRLKSIRKDIGYSQRELALQAKVSLNRLGLVERNKRMFILEQMLRIAEVLKVSVLDIFPDWRPYLYQIKRS